MEKVIFTKNEIENIKPVEIIIVDKRNNKLIKKEIT